MPHVSTLLRAMQAGVRYGSRGISCCEYRGEELYALPHWDEQPGGEEEEQEGDILGKTLQGFAQLEQTGCILPDHHYLSLLKDCHTRKDLSLSKQVYEHLKRYKGGQLAGVLGDYLVISMVKCGGLEDALLVFNSLSQRNVYSWTALISGFTESGQGQEAVKLHKLMKNEGIEPNHYTIVSLLKACGSIPWLLKGFALHTEVEEKGWASDIFIGSSLVSMYGKCGRLEEAEHLFSNMFQRNIVTWNGMLSAYVQQEKAEKALRLYRQMIEVACLNDMTYMIALQACGILVDKEEPNVSDANTVKMFSFSICQALHGIARKKGFTANLGSTLVSVYGKCLAVQEAENVFYVLDSPNVTAWSAMISVYVENGQGQLALQLFCHMQHRAVNPNEWTFVSVLHACGIIALDTESSRGLNVIDIGQALHNDAKRLGFVWHPFVGNSLLTMYNKVGTIEKAESVFAEMPHSNVISWNAMLSAYVDQGQEVLALQLYRQMLEENKQPNDQTLTIVINACRSLAVKEEAFAKQDAKLVALEVGQALHADALREGILSNAYVGNTLITMYSRCGKLADLEQVFQGLFTRNIISWNAMLSAYAENGFELRALQLFLQMVEIGVSIKSLTFRILLQACGSLLDKVNSTSGQRQSPLSKSVAVKLVEALHADAERMDFDKDPSIASILMSLYNKCDMVADASCLFEALCQKDVSLCNVMLSIYVEHALSEQALCLYRHMLLKFGADEATIVYILQACSDLGCMDDARELHFTLISSNHDSSCLVSTTLIHTYGYCKAMIDVEPVFDSILEPDIVSWSACLAGYAREGNYNASLHCFLEMKARGVKANRVAFLSLLHLCSHTGLVCEGLEYFESMNREYDIEPDMKCYAGVIDLLGRAGDFIKVRNMLSRLPMQHDLPIWLCILSVCCIHGNMDLGSHAFDCAVSLQPEDVASYILMEKMSAYDEVLDPVKSFEGVQEQSPFLKVSDPCQHV
ncbi:hypothetical protein L7F22_064181 [Adiantum nelumboides]|nr:hypothetical protein [Adiantum nelumboides]